MCLRPLLALLAMLTAMGAAQLACAEPLRDYFVETWTTQDGLPHNSVNSITQTPDGYIWFATWEGVVRYNGRQFKHFGWGKDTHLRDSGIRTLAVNSQGELLVAGSRGSFARYAERDWHAMPQLDARINQVLVDHKQNLWIATNNQGLFVQDVHGEITHFGIPAGLPSLSIKALLEDTDGQLWIGTTAGLAYFDGHAFQLQQDIPQLPVVSLAKDKEARLLVASETGIYRQTPNGFAAFHHDSISHGVSQILIDNQDALWIGTINHGLYRLYNGRLDHKGVYEGLPDSRIKALFQDREGSIWIGTNGGLVRLRKANFTTISTKSGLVGDYVRTVLATKDKALLVGTSNGLSRISEGDVNTVSLPLPNNDVPSVLSLAENADSYLIGTYSHGLLMLSKITGKIQQMGTEQGLLANHIRSLFVASDNSIWIGTTRGLSHLVDGQLSHFDKQKGLTDEYTMAINEGPGGEIWIGTEMSAQVIRGGQIVNIDITQHDQARSVYGFYPGKEGRYMWMATDRGLIRYRYEDGQTRLIGRQQGLPIDKFWQVAEDNQDYLWLTSNLGIVRLPLESANSVADGKTEKVAYRVFADGDGMQSFQANGTTSPAIAKDPAGDIWVATAKGIVRTRPANIRRMNPSNLPMQMERVEVDGVNMTSNLPSQLPAHTNRISFEFVALGYIMPQTIQYKTRLMGFDKTWVERNNNNIAEYTNLPPGDYVFEVEATYPTSEEGKGVGKLRKAFSIAPAFWQRKDVFAITLILAIALLFIVIRTREHILKHQSEQLKRRVQEQTQALQEQAQRFERLSLQDQLTGLENRRSFDSFLKNLDRHNNRNVLAYVAILDIDHFKRINDMWSHDTGDQVLREVGRIITRNTRPGDHAARWGGEEFSLIIKDVDESTAVSICERIRQQVEATDFNHIAPGLNVTISAGLKRCDDTGNHHRTLVLADQALYHAKENGRNQVQLWQADLPARNSHTSSVES
ncbi:two-component regulator propeller domain-containing protein [Bowmanella yangjiangensis]|uniref:diguanylate cyclase n=1 Tax=Bowmanella yangjiangensis TaxID=2811230 RepID=A0ABS3CQY3_9ALTE|nr:ligand-binding sensor domain-containing diguanylate cyclase [Bowmanella yangjiangensis]MBN7819455.1 diguanylate cyclase [Bowmanella yangjiangensis]